MAEDGAPSPRTPSPRTPSPRTPSPRVHTTGGFMLVEVVVALAIAAMAFAYAFPSLSVSLERLRRDQNEARALTLAQSILDRVGHDVPLTMGEIGGAVADGFSWRITATPQDLVALPADFPVTAHVLRIVVAWSERGNPRQVALTTARLFHPGATR